MQEVEADFESEDPARRRAAMRKLGVHIMRMHQDMQNMIGRHTVDGKEVDVQRGYERLERMERAMFGIEDQGLEKKQKGLVDIYQDLDRLRSLVCYAIYGIGGIIALIGVPKVWEAIKAMVSSSV
jgi:hypothetical protein